MAFLPRGGQHGLCNQLINLNSESVTLIFAWLQIWCKFRWIPALLNSSAMTVLHGLRQFPLVCVSRVVGWIQKVFCCIRSMEIHVNFDNFLFDFPDLLWCWCFVLTPMYLTHVAQILAINSRNMNSDTLLDMSNFVCSCTLTHSNIFSPSLAIKTKVFHVYFLWVHFFQPCPFHS